MLEVADAWAGWASTLVGGAVGALTVVLGVVVAYLFSERSRREERSHDELRRVKDERRAAAAQLMVELSNLRDEVCGRSKGLTGSAELWRMRNTLFVTHMPLRNYPSYEVVGGFYQAALAWRQWVRAAQDTAGTPAELRSQYPIVDEYREVLRSYGDQVIKVLQDHLEDQLLDYTPPELPTLPDLPDRCERDGQ